VHTLRNLGYEGALGGPNGPSKGLVEATLRAASNNKVAQARAFSKKTRNARGGFSLLTVWIDSIFTFNGGMGWSPRACSTPVLESESSGARAWASEGNRG